MRICGSVSPEGPSGFNDMLLERRAEALRSLIRDRLDITDEDACNTLPANVREVSRMAAAMAVPVSSLYSDLRYSSVDFAVARAVWPEYGADDHNDTEMTVIEPVVQMTPSTDDVVHSDSVPQEPQPYPATAATGSMPQRWHVKTNLMGWTMMVSNIAIECDFGPHWSITLPVYYSGVNYFTRTLKFRTFTIQPEVRYWFGDHSDTAPQWFVGAHLGVGWYNYALKGDYRIQDVDGDTPAWGGGLSAGYRLTLPWGSRDRWKMEFTLGVGVYDARYDKWINTYGGALAKGRRHTTFVGIDQAAATLIYSF